MSAVRASPTATSDFVLARHRFGAAPLLPDERAALGRLIATPDLLAIADFLSPDRVQALSDRAQKMLSRCQILRPGEF